MQLSFSSLPYEILREILLLLEDWDSLEGFALSERAVHSVYESSKDYINEKITERVRRSYSPPSIKLQLKLTPSTLDYSSLSPDLLPVKIQFVATLSGSRPIMLYITHSPFCEQETKRVGLWTGAKKEGPWCSHFGENTVFLHEIAPSGERTELSTPQRPLPRGTRSGGTYGRMLRFYSDGPEDFLFLEPGIPWVSQELDIPNFPCKQGYEYVAGVDEEPWGDWWCYGTKEEFLAAEKDELWDYRMVVEARMRREMRLGEQAAIDGWFDEMEFPVVRSEGFKVL